MSRTALADQYLQVADENLHVLLQQADEDLARYADGDPIVRMWRTALWKARLEEAAEAVYLETWNAIHARTWKMAG